jgi:hypothetical protein
LEDQQALILQNELYEFQESEMPEFKTSTFTRHLIHSHSTYLTSNQLFQNNNDFYGENDTHRPNSKVSPNKKLVQSSVTSLSFILQDEIKNAHSFNSDEEILNQENKNIDFKQDYCSELIHYDKPSSAYSHTFPKSNWFKRILNLILINFSFPSFILSR